MIARFTAALLHTVFSVAALFYPGGWFCAKGVIAIQQGHYIAGALLLVVGTLAMGVVLGIYFYGWQRLTTCEKSRQPRGRRLRLPAHSRR